MTLTKLPGVYFTETVDNFTVDVEYIPLFIVQTSTAIADLDEQLVYFDNFESFRLLATNKGLPVTLEVMEQVFSTSQYTPFYVYSVKQDTSTAFTNLLVDCGSHREIKKVVYIEETKSSNNNTILQKIGAIATALDENNYNVGAFRRALIVPYGTITDAVTTAENVAPATTVHNWFTTQTFAKSGRITLIVPDVAYAGTLIGIDLSKEFDEEIGYEPITASIGELTYKFNDTQLKDLTNAGVLCIREERYGGALQYRIVAGVTTNFALNKADGLIVSRDIADEVLAEVRDSAEQSVKEIEASNVTAVLQSAVNGIIKSYTNDGLIKSNSLLSVAADGDTINIQGQIAPVGTIFVIEVNTRITK